MKTFKKSKLIFMGVISAFLVLVLAACSSGDKASTKDSADGETITLRLANTVTDDHASNIAWNEIIPEIEEKSEGHLKIELYPNGQLFASDREAVEAVQMKNVEMTEISSPTMETFNPKFGVFDLPFLFKNREIAYAAQDGELGDMLNDELLGMNLVGLGYGENGFRHFLNNKKPIETPDDFKGMKVRVIESKIYEDIFNTLGANASPLAFGEVYSAMQQGVFDGMDNTISLITAMKFNEVQKYLTISGYTYSPTITIINKEIYEDMPEDLQAILNDAIEKFSQRQRELTVQQDEEGLKKLAESMEINELTDAQKEEFANKLEPIYDKYRDKIGGDVIDLAQGFNN